MEATNLPYSTQIEKLAELENFVGKEIGISNWTEITQEQIDTFARVTDDDQWIHTDPERSEKYSPYKKTVAHGFFVLSLASKFCAEILKVNDMQMGVNYGLDKVRFMNATKVNSLLRARISLLDYAVIQGGARYKLKLVFEIQGIEKPACVAEFIGQGYV